MSYKKTGIWLIVGPFIALVTIIFLAVVINASLNLASSSADVGTASCTSWQIEQGLCSASLHTLTSELINWFFLFLGFVAVLGIIICVPTGIYLLIRKLDVVALQGNPKYQGLSLEQIVFITNPSWGSFFLPPVWALGNRLYPWALGGVVPVFNFYVWIRLFAMGRKMAWEEGGWGSFDQFKKRQKVTAWIILFVLIAIIIITSLLPQQA